MTDEEMEFIEGQKKKPTPLPTFEYEYGVPEYLTDEEHERYEGAGESVEGEVRVSRSTIRSIVRRPIMVKILTFLYEHNDPYYIAEICNAIYTNPTTFLYNVKKLLDAGLVKRVIAEPIDKRTAYYELVDKRVVEQIIKRYRWMVGFKLAKLLSYNKTTHINELKADSCFLSLCEKYGLSFEEAIECLKNCRKVDKVTDYHQRLIGFRRRGQ